MLNLQYGNYTHVEIINTVSPLVVRPSYNVYLFNPIYLFISFLTEPANTQILQMYLHLIHYIWKLEGCDRQKKKEAIWQFIVRYIPRTCNKFTDEHISLWKARRNEFNVEQMLHYYDNTCALMT